MTSLKRKLQKTNKDQFTLTIPKTICKTGWKAGDDISFEIIEKNKLIIIRSDKNENKQK